MMVLVFLCLLLLPLLIIIITIVIKNFSGKVVMENAPNILNLSNNVKTEVLFKGS